MLYILGIITGLLMATILIGAIAIFQPKVDTIANPFLPLRKKNKGYIVDVPSEREEARQRIIQHNAEQEKGTSWEELE